MKGTGGLVTSPPISTVKALRNLEKAYAEKASALDKAQAEIEKLKAEIKCIKAQKPSGMTSGSARRSGNGKQKATAA